MPFLCGPRGSRSYHTVRGTCLKRILKQQKVFSHYRKTMTDKFLMLLAVNLKVDVIRDLQAIALPISVFWIVYG